MPAVDWPGREAEYSPPSSSEKKNKWSWLVLSIHPRSEWPHPTSFTKSEIEENLR